LNQLFDDFSRKDIEDQIKYVCRMNKNVEPEMVLCSFAEGIGDPHLTIFNLQAGSMKKLASESYSIEMRLASEILEADTWIRLKHVRKRKQHLYLIDDDLMNFPMVIRNEALCPDKCGQYLTSLDGYEEHKTVECSMRLFTCHCGEQMREIQRSGHVLGCIKFKAHFEGLLTHLKSRYTEEVLKDYLLHLLKKSECNNSAMVMCALADCLGNVDLASTKLHKNPKYWDEMKLYAKACQAERFVPNLDPPESANVEILVDDETLKYFASPALTPNEKILNDGEILDKSFKEDLTQNATDLNENQKPVDGTFFECRCGESVEKNHREMHLEFCTTFTASWDFLIREFLKSMECSELGLEERLLKALSQRNIPQEVMLCALAETDGDITAAVQKSKRKNYLRDMKLGAKVLGLKSMFENSSLSI